MDNGRSYEKATSLLLSDSKWCKIGRIPNLPQEGVVTLTGQVNSAREKGHVEDLVQTALDSSGTKYERIENQLQVV